MGLDSKIFLDLKILHKSEIGDISKIHPIFLNLKKENLIGNIKKSWTINNNLSYFLQVTFIGKTGYGKSTTINSIIGKNIFKSDDVKSCTKTGQSVIYKISDYSKHFLSFLDLPGVGESIEEDKKYYDMYSNFLFKSNVVIHVLRADNRDYTIDLELHKTVLKKHRNNIVIGLNFSDKIEPINRNNDYEPTIKQQENINIKINHLSRLFDVPKENIIPYSAYSKWNINKLIEVIFSNLVKNLN